MSFSSLGLSEALLRAVAEHGYTTPTPIQAQAIPAVLAGGDLLAGAQTGTGKTAGFVLPMLQRLSTRPSPHAQTRRKPLRALILTPTRELAAQVEESIRVYGKHLKLTSMVIFGGVGIGAQTAQLKRGIDILVATPGRLLDHHGQGNVDFSHGRVLRARRGRPDARHGLHPGREARARAAAEEAADPPLLRHLLGRDQGTRRQAPRPSARDRSDATQLDGRRDRPARASGEPRAEGPACSHG